MSLDKAIEHGKEKRKPYRGAKAVDCMCRNHGSCEWCKNNRLYSRLRTDEAGKQALEEFEKDVNAQDAMIRATRELSVTKDDLLDVYYQKGLSGVYNLGLKTMLDYLTVK